MLSNPPQSPFKKVGKHELSKERIPSFIKRGMGRLLMQTSFHILL
jgi:hypothetical protein